MHAPAQTNHPYLRTRSTRKNSVFYSEQPRLNNNYLQSFMQSILPNFNPDTDLALPDEAEGAAGGGGRPGEFRQSVTRLLDAMRDLLGNIDLPAHPHENNGNPDDVDDEDEWA